METNTVQCRNCEEEFKEGFEFCPHCGQKAKDDLTLGVLFYNTISNYFSFDARFFRSFIPLMLKPGYVARRFVEGKRLQYLHPAQYYLFVSVIFFFLFSFEARKYSQAVDQVLKKGFETENVLQFDTIQPILDTLSVKKMTEGLKDSQLITGVSDEEIKEMDSLLKETTKPKDFNLSLNYKKEVVDSLINAGAPDKDIFKAMGMKEDAGFLTRRFYGQLLKLQKNRGGGIIQAFIDSIPMSLFFLLPIFAMILKLFYWRRGRFTHHLVFSFYYFSFLFVVMSLILVGNYITDIPDWIDWMILLSTFLYLWLSLKHFYRQGYFISFLKAGFSSFLYMTFVIPIAIVFMFIASLIFY